MHKTYQAKNFGIVCGKKNDRGGRNIFIFRSEIGSVTGGIRRHGRIYRFADAIFYRLGLCRSFLSAFVAGSILPFSSEVVLVILVRMGLDPLLCLFAAASGKYARRYDLLLDRAFGQAGLDYPLPAGRAGENRPGFPFSRRERGLVRFFSPFCPMSAKPSPSYSA